MHQHHGARLANNGQKGPFVPRLPRACSAAPLTYDHLRSVRLLEHVQHLRLEDGINCFDTDPRTGLWHGEYINHTDRIFIDELAQHQTHHFHGNTGTTVLDRKK